MSRTDFVSRRDRCCSLAYEWHDACIDSGKAATEMCSREDTREAGAMQNLLSSLEPREAETGLVHVVIDTPRGSRNERLGPDEAEECLEAAIAEFGKPNGS